MKDKKYYQYIVKEKDRIAETFKSHSIRRLLAGIRTINFNSGNKKVYLKVTYGNGFYNDGDYLDMASLLKAVKQFDESELPEYATRGQKSPTDGILPFRQARFLEKNGWNEGSSTFGQLSR